MRILFVHNSLRTFVQIDRDILASEHEVDEIDLSVRSRIASLPGRLGRADMVFCWFAGLHSLAPALAGRASGKPVIAVVGAYDAANVPEIGFGHMGHPWKRYAVRAICEVSCLLICNSDYAVKTVERNVGPRTPIFRLYHGVQFPNTPLNLQRERLALTVGLIRRENLARKGHEIFARAASLLPDVRFLLAGRIIDDAACRLRGIGPLNFELHDHLPEADLYDLYSRSSAYVQASAHESFGLSVVEAMGSGAMPVVSRKGALPEIVGEHGIFVDEKSAESVAGGIRKALEATPSEREKTAAYVRGRFPLELRRKGLLEAVAKVT